MVVIAFAIVGWYGFERAVELRATQFVLALPLIRLVKHVDMGMARVAWSTYQIISSISWNLNVPYPLPVRGALGALGFLQLDFFSFDCVRFHQCLCVCGFV